jgi:hypothetical protein
MVVMLIIGVLAGIAVPALKGMGQANRSAAAHRQILDDLALARLRAINDRSPVYLVFSPPRVHDAFAIGPRTSTELKQLTNLLGSQYTAYALLSTRTVGDQPGHPHPRYISEWKSLPEGLVFAPYKFEKNNYTNDYGRRLLIKNNLPFPSATSKPFVQGLPCIGFDGEGHLVTQQDEVVALAKGSVFAPQGADGTRRIALADVELNPKPKPNADPRTQTNTYQFIRINWLTGRAKVEIPEIR